MANGGQACRAGHGTYCTSGQCDSGQLSLSWFLSLDDWAGLPGAAPGKSRAPSPARPCSLLRLGAFGFSPHTSPSCQRPSTMLPSQCRTCCPARGPGPGHCLPPVVEPTYALGGELRGSVEGATGWPRC